MPYFCHINIKIVIGCGGRWNNSSWQGQSYIELCNYIISADIFRLAALASLFNRHFYLHVFNSVYEHEYVTLIQVIIVTGGQKQRIALARAIIKVSNILYIDVLSCYVVFSLADNKLLTTYTNVCLLFHVWWPKHFFKYSSTLHTHVFVTWINLMNFLVGRI